MSRFIVLEGPERESFNIVQKKDESQRYLFWKGDKCELIAYSPWTHDAFRYIQGKWVEGDYENMQSYILLCAEKNDLRGVGSHT